MLFNTADVASFRSALSGKFYRRWRNTLGEQSWRLLEASVGHPM